MSNDIDNGGIDREILEKKHWNVNNFTSEYLITEGLGLDYENTNEDEISEQATEIINNRLRNGIVDEATFYKDVKIKILNELCDEECIQNKFSWEYEHTQDSVTAPSRFDKKIVGSDPHYIIKQERLDIGQSVNVPHGKGTINPTQRNTVKRMLYINSAHRTRTEYKETCDDTSHFNTEFMINLSEPLLNVLSIKLHSIQIPNTWYVFDHHLKNNFFYCKNKEKKITLKPGNYIPSDLLSDLKKTENYTPTSSISSLTFIFTENKFSITSSDKTTNVINFFDKKDINYFDQSLGWYMGYRPSASFKTGVDVNTRPAISQMEPNVHGPSSFLLLIDDFNHNRLNSAFVSSNNIDTKRTDLPSYYSTSKKIGHLVADGEYNNLKDDISGASGLTPDKLDTAVNLAEKMLAPPTKGSHMEYPNKNTTQAMRYAANEILANLDTEVVYTPAVSTNDIFAIIPITNRKGGESVDTSTMLTASGEELQNNERMYFGPVNIDKLRIKLLDDKGNLVNLNDCDGSFTICVEQLYQY